MYRQFNEIFFQTFKMFTPAICNFLPSIKDAGVPEFSKKHPICAKKQEFKVNKTNASKLIPPLHQKQ